MMICILSFFIYLTTSRFYEVVAIRAVKGSTVQLECPYKDNGAGTLDWSFKSTTSSTFVVYTANTFIDPNIPSEVSTRLTVTGNHAIGQYHLSISNIRESDQGTYNCIDGASGNQQDQTLVIIVGPTAVSLHNLTPDNKIPGIEGRQMTIKCTAVGGQPDPDVELIVLRRTYVGKKSSQHIFTPVAGDDGSNVTCKAGYTDISYYPLTVSAQIHLNLKPVLTPFSPDALNTDEINYFDVSCQSVGSRPAALMYWFLGQKITNITSNSSNEFIHNSSADVYTVISTLKYRVDRRYNGQTLICAASNVAGYMETSLTLNVKYAPGVSVKNKTFSQIQSPRQILSTLDCNPQVNSCKWHHRSKYGEYIRQFSDSNQILTLPKVSVDQRYQDTGEYVCTAENGITGINGQLKQTGSGYVTSNAPPVITADNSDNYTQYGKFGKSTKVYVNVYSIPKYSKLNWYIGNTQLVSNKYVIKEEPAIVKDVFHGVEVQLNGYRITLTISDLSEADFTNYTLRFYDSFSQYIQHEVTLDSANSPETPSNFAITSSGETSITVQWKPRYDGGQKLTFFVQYRTSGTNTWMLQEIITINKTDIHNFYTVSGLQEKTTYELRMYAQNAFNQSQKTDTATTTTQQSVFKEAQTSSNEITGALAGMVVVLLIACAIIISILVFKKRKGTKKTNKDTGFYENSGFQNVQNGEEYEEVVNKSDTQQEQTSKIYESLGTKDAVDVYADLDNRQGLPSSKPSVDHNEILNGKDKPNFYEELENRKGQTEKVYVNEAF